MRCEERGVDKFECPSVSVLYHYPSLKIDRSHLKKEIRCHAFTVLGGASSPLAGRTVRLQGLPHTTSGTGNKRCPVLARLLKFPLKHAPNERLVVHKSVGKSDNQPVYSAHASMWQFFTFKTHVSHFGSAITRSPSECSQTEPKRRNPAKASACPQNSCCCLQVCAHVWPFV